MAPYVKVGGRAKERTLLRLGPVSEVQPRVVYNAKRVCAARRPI